MKHLLTTLLLATLCATGYGQTIKSLGYNTSNNVIVGPTNTNSLVFSNETTFINSAFFGGGDIRIGNGSLDFGGTERISLEETRFAGDWTFDQPGSVRTNLGLGATWLTNTNVTNFRTAIGLGATNNVRFAEADFDGAVRINEVLSVSDAIIVGEPTNNIEIDNGRILFNSNGAAATRTNLGLGSTNNVAFRNITSDGNVIISNQTAANNGLLFIYRTNNEPFLGLANLIASNNTTISNETLFRVGVAEATNKAAQFGFRSTNTNGNGVAVFSVFGYNALAMIGPSTRSATNTNGIEADIYSISPTNKVATLIDTNTGATLMHRPVGFNSNATTPANTTNVVGWIEFYVGSNSVRVPYYQ
jgi:hypothetical protein